MNIYGSHRFQRQIILFKISLFCFVQKNSIAFWNLMLDTQEFANWSQPFMHCYITLKNITLWNCNSKLKQWKSLQTFWLQCFSSRYNGVLIGLHLASVTHDVIIENYKLPLFHPQYCMGPIITHMTENKFEYFHSYKQIVSKEHKKLHLNDLIYCKFCPFSQPFVNKNTK